MCVASAAAVVVAAVSRAPARAAAAAAAAHLSMRGLTQQTSERRRRSWLAQLLALQERAPLEQTGTRHRSGHG
jgi:hypothetical protein